MSTKKDIVAIQLQIEQIMGELRASDDPNLRTLVPDLEAKQLQLLKAAVESEHKTKAQPKKAPSKEGQIIIQDPCEMEPLKSAPWYIRWSMGCFGS